MNRRGLPSVCLKHTKSVYNKILSTRPSNLLAYLPLHETSGTVAKNYAPPRTGINIVRNPGFELPGAGGADVYGSWVESAGDGAIADETTLFHSGLHACKLTSGATSNTSIYGTQKVTPGVAYSVSFWARGDGTNAGRYKIYDATNSADIVATATTGVTGTSYSQVSTTARGSSSA